MDRTKGIAREIRAGLQPVVDLIYPPRCPLCGAALAMQGGLCIDCWNTIEPATEEVPACDTPRDRAARDQAGQGQIIAATIYNATSRQMVLNFKHGRKLALAPLMARMMGQAMNSQSASATTAHAAAGTEIALLVPVPLHRLRLWERGFNQAALLAGELAKLGAGQLCVDALVRTKRTPSLGGLGREGRARMLENAVRIRDSRRQMVAKRDIVLVDDVYTSGATASACSAVLMAAGANRVRTVCFARVE